MVLLRLLPDRCSARDYTVRGYGPHLRAKRDAREQTGGQAGQTGRRFNDGERLSPDSDPSDAFLKYEELLEAGALNDCAVLPLTRTVYRVVRAGTVSGIDPPTAKPRRPHWGEPNRPWPNA